MHSSFEKKQQSRAVCTITHTHTQAHSHFAAEPISGESGAVWLLVKNEGRQEDGEGEEERRHKGGGEN